MIEQTTLHNILTWIIAIVLFIFQSLKYLISRIKRFVKHGQKNTTVVTTDTIILSELNPNNNNAPENVITVQGLIQKHFDIPLIIAEDEPKVNDFIENDQLLTSYDNYKEKKKIDQFMEHLVDDSYVARGLGLITANVGREAEFYLYSKYDNNFENVVIKLKGRQGEIGQITIPNQNSTNSIETKSIPMDYFYDEDRIKVTYTPFAEGVYTLTLVRNGLSICRSPYYISVEKSPTNSRSQIRLGTKKYKMVTKFTKTKHVPLETCDNSIPLIEPSKPSISRNILPKPEENSIRTDVMSIVTKFESNSIHFQKNDQKHTVNKSKKSTKTDQFDEISISADSNTQPKIEAGNDYDTKINDSSSLNINSNSKSNDKKCSSNLDVSNRNSKSNYVNSIEIESKLVKKSNKKLDESIRNINDKPRVKNISSNRLEPTNSVLLKETLNDKSSDDVEKHNQTYKTNEPIHGQNQIETFLNPITVDKSEIKFIDNEAFTHNEVPYFDDDRKTVIVMKNINELETHPNISMNRQFTDSTQYNINTPFTSFLTKITNDVCEKCSIKVLRILSEFPRDINITHKNNSNENCSSFETLLAQPISINIDNSFEKPINPTNEHKTDNLLTNSPTNMKLMDTIDKDIKYHYINEIKPIDTTFNEIYCDINNTTTKLMVKQNKHDNEINKTINDKITNNFTIPLTKNNIDKPKTDHLKNILSTDNKMQIQVQNVQKSSEHNMDINKTNQIKFHEYIDNELNDINKENGKILDTCDNIVTINNDKKSNEDLVTKELKAKNVIISDEYKNIQSNFINNQTVLASMEDKLPTSRYKPEDIRQEISNISNTNVRLPENQKLIIENSIEPVLKNFKDKMVEKITQLYLNKDLTSSDNTSIIENHNINLTNNLQKNQLHYNANNKNNKTKLIETIRSQLKNHFHKNDIQGMILNNKKPDNNQLYKHLENIIKTNINPDEIYSQRLDEINFQTLVSIAKNQLNKQQLGNEFKIMTLENVTPNFEIKKTNDDEKVQDTEIKLKNIPNDTNIKIEAITKSIKSNTSEETDVESNKDNKKKGELIKLKNKVNDLRKIQNMFKINEIGENNNRDTTIKSKPTENASIEQIKKQEDKVVKIKIFNDAKDITIEKENIYKFPYLNINENVIIEKPNSEVLVPTKNTDVSKNTAKETKELKIASESPAYNDLKNISKHKINHEKIENTDKTLDNNKSELIISHSQLANDSTPVIVIQLNRENNDSYKSLNIKHKLTTLESTMYKMNCNKIKNKTIIPNNSSSAVIVTVNKENKTSTIIDTSRVTEIKLDKINNSAQTDTSTLINQSIKPQVQKFVVKIVTNNDKTIVDSVAVIIHEEIEENKKVAKKNNQKTNYWIQINDHEVYTKIAYHDTIEPIDKDKVIETEMPKISIQMDITIANNLKESNKNEIEESSKNDLIIETPTIPVQKSEKVENINQTKIIQYTESSTEHIEAPIDVEIFYKQKILKNDIQTNKTKQNFKKESKSYLLIDTSNVPVEQNNIIGKSIEHEISIENSNESVKESKVIKATTETELIKKSDSLAFNKEEATGKNNNPETDIETDKSIENIIRKDEASSMIDTSKESVENKNIRIKTIEDPLSNEQTTKSIEELKIVDINTASEQIPNSIIANIEEPISKNNVHETQIKTVKTKDNIVKEMESCSATDKSFVSIKKKQIIDETIENPLPNNQPTKSIEIETTTNTDSSTLNVEEKIDKDINPESETQTEKSTNNMNIESETCSPANASTVSNEEMITIIETTEKSLKNDQQTKTVDELKILDINTDSESILNNDSLKVMVEEPIDKDIYPDTETQKEKSTVNMNTESVTCSPTDALSVSNEETITIIETSEMQLPKNQPNKSVYELKIVDINTESESILNNDSSTVNVEEPIDKDISPETETQTEKSPNNMNIESETCSKANASTVSNEEKITIVETTEIPLPTEPEIKSVDELKIVDIDTDSKSILNNDSSTVNVEEPIDKDIYPDTETQTEKSTDNMNTESVTCSPTDELSVSNEETITIIETTEMQLPKNQPNKSVYELKIVDINTDSESILNNDSSTVNVEEPNDKDINPESETQTEKSPNNMNIESETCSKADASTASDEEKTTIIETTKKPLPTEPPMKFVDELKIVDINTESESILNNDSSIAKLEEAIDKDVYPDTETQTEKSTDNMNTESVTCSPTDELSVSNEETITIIETTEISLPKNQPNKSVDELKIVDIDTDSKSILNNDSSTVNVEEKIDNDNALQTETQTEKSTDNMNTESETCSPTDALTVSQEERRTIIETVEKPLPKYISTKSVDEIKVVVINTKPESIITNDSSIAKLEETIDIYVSTKSETQTEKSTDNMNTETETCSPTDALSVSNEETITIIETTEKALKNDQQTKTVDELKFLDINTDSESILKNDSLTVMLEERIDSNIYPETETQTEKSTVNMNIESETCSPANATTVSNEEKITIVETTEKPIPNNRQTKTVDELKIVGSDTDSESILNNDSSTVNVEEPNDKDINPESETQTEKSPNNMNIESETCSKADASTASDEEKTTIIETTKKPLPTEPPMKFVDELKIVDINTESESILNNDSSIAKLEEAIDKDVYPETETQMEKLTDNMNTKSETCSPTDALTVSNEETITIIETTEMPLPKNQPNKSVDELKIVDINTESESILNNDSSIAKLEEAIDKDISPETETQPEKSTDNMNIEIETCSPANASTVSNEETITIIETTEMQLPKNQSNKSVDELKIVDIKTESESILNNESSIAKLEEAIDKDAYPETETQMEKSTDNMNTKTEKCPPTDALTVSNEETITIIETTKIPLPKNQPNKSVDELKIVDINTESESILNNESSIAKLEEAIDKDAYPETETLTEKSTVNMNIESKTCSQANASTVSNDEKITIVEITEIPLPTEPEIKSLDELTIVDIDTDSESILNNDSSTVNVEEPIDKDISPETETQTEKSTDNMNIESETCSPTDALTVCNEEETITIIETTEKSLKIDQQTKTVDELKILGIDTESESILNNDFSTVNVEEPIDKDVYPETETQTEKSTVNMNKETVTCSPANASTVSNEEKITIVETTEMPLPTAPEIKSVDQLKIVDINTDSKSILNNDSSIAKLEEPFDKDISPETETQTEKSTENMNKESETCSPTDALTVFNKETITIIETTEKSLKNDQQTKTVDELKFLDINTDSESILNNDSLTVMIEETIDNNIYPETETQTEKSTVNMNIESETCSPTDALTASNEETITIIETTEKSLKNDQQTKTVDELKFLDINTDSESILNNDSSTVNVEEPNDKDINPESETQTEKSTNNMNIESETCSKADASTASDEEKTSIVETTEIPLPTEPEIKSLDELKIVDINTESESILNNDSSIAKLEEPIDKDISPETETQTEKSTENMNKESETCSPTDALTVSNKETITIIETTEKSLKNDQQTKTVDELKFLDINTDSESILNNDSLTVMIEETIDNNIYPETETQTEKSTVNMNIESETCSPTDALTASNEETITIIETTEKSLKNDQQTKTVDELKFLDINTDSESILNNDSSTVNVEEPNDKDINPESETQTEKSTNNMNIESETCSKADASTASDEEKTSIVETTEIPLPTEPEIKSLDELKIVDINTESESILNNDSSIAKLEEPIDKDISPETETQTEKSTENMNKESETCSPTDALTVSNKETITIIETTEKSLKNDQQTKTVDELKFLDINTDSESILNNDSSTVNVEEPIDNDNSLETETQTEISTDNMNTESETCSPTDELTVSNEEKRTIEETIEMSLPKNQPNKSVDELKILDINTDSESILNNDSSSVNVEEPIDKDVYPETETQKKKLTDNMNAESETCSSTDASSVSQEERRTIIETAEKPLPKYISTKSVDELKVVVINTKPESIINNDSSIAKLEETIDIYVSTKSETQTEKSTDNMNKESETCSPTDALTVSNKETITIIETTEKSLKIDQQTKTVDELKILDINTVSESILNNDSSTVNVEEPNDKDINPESETQTEKSTNYMNIESETCSKADASTASDEEKTTIIETTEKPLPTEPPMKFVDELKIVDINTESESILNNDSSIAKLEEAIDKDVYPETETQMEKLTDNMNTKSETCSPTDALTVSNEETITIIETTEMPLPKNQPNKSVDELKIVDINTESESILNNDSSIAKLEEAIDKDVYPETETLTEKSTVNMNIESKTCSQANASTVSNDEKISIVETTEIPLPTEPEIKSLDELTIVDIDTDSESILNNDSSTVNVEEPIDKDIYPDTETQTEKSTDNMNTESVTCSPTDALSVSNEETITIIETTEMQLPKNQPNKSVYELKIVDINTESESILNNDSSIAKLEEPIDKDISPETETQTEKSTYNMNKESETCSPTDALTVSNKETITIIETTEKSLKNYQQTKTVDELKFLDINTDSESILNNDSLTVMVEETIDNNIYPETETQTEKSTVNMNKEAVICSPANASTVSNKETITIIETTEMPLPKNQPNKSVDELKIVDINTASESILNNDSSIAKLEEPIHKDIPPETETQTEKSTDNMNIEIETCSPANASTVSNEETITIIETTEMQLPKNQSNKSVDINTESELLPNNDSSIANLEEPMNKYNVPETQIEAIKTLKNIEKESETCLHTHTSSFSIEEINVIYGTISNPLPINTPIKSIDEIKVVDINTESESILNNDSSTTNLEEPIDKEIISETQTQTEISADNINIESEPYSPFDTPTVSNEEMIITVETIEKLLPNETPIKSVEELKVVDINTETEPEANTDSLAINVEGIIDKENIRKIQIETNKLIDNPNIVCESCSSTNTFAASDGENNLTEETIENLSPIEISTKSSIKGVDESKVKKVNTDTVFVPNTDSLTINAEEPLDEDYFSKMTDKTLDFIVKQCETCPSIDTSMYVTEEIKEIDDTIEKLIPIDPSFMVVETENLTSIDGFNRIVNRQSGREYLKDIESSTHIDAAEFVKDQKVEENETVIKNILTINTSTASLQGQIQVEEVIKDESVKLINDSVTFDKMSPEEQKKLETAKISSITIMEEQTDINRDDVICTCEKSLDKTIVEKGIHSETTSTIDILAAVVEEQRALEKEFSENATQVQYDTSTKTIENLIKTKKKTENETTTPIVVAKSEVERNEIKVMSENKTSSPVHLASTNTEQFETDMVTEIASSNVNILNSNTKIILIDKEMITENSNNPKHCYLKFGETSKIHSLENEDNLPGKSYGIQKLEMSVQRMKTSNEDYYQKTFLQLEQTEKISVENKDKVDCENKNIIDDKLYTVNESDLNAILCASSLEEALTLLDSKIKFKFKHRKLSNKANSTPHIPKIQTSDSRSSGTNKNFTDAREFFKEIEKKCKK